MGVMMMRRDRRCVRTRLFDEAPSAWSSLGGRRLASKPGENLGLGFVRPWDAEIVKQELHKVLELFLRYHHSSRRFGPGAKQNSSNT